MPTIDINCDFGENFGAYTIGADERIFDYVTSVNIACGFHAGDPKTMRETVARAVEAGVGIGAHPGYDDLAGFGRRYMDLSPEEIYDLVMYQIGALQGFATAAGGCVRHVKPHGALYNTAAKNAEVAAAIAEAVKDVDAELILFGLSGGELVRAGRDAGLTTASEVFADRTYQPDGRLTPRKMDNALIEDRGQAVEQVLQMVQNGTVTAVDGNDVAIEADTLCLHGDGRHALAFAETIHQRLTTENIDIRQIFDR